MNLPYARKRTSAKPRVVDGVTFHCYHTGILQYQWFSEDGRARVGRNHNRHSYWASVDGESIGRLFRGDRTAMKAAAKKLT